MNYGIPEKSLELIRKALSKWGEIEKVLIFGSRAMGNYKRGSDVDLCIFGSKVTEEIVNKLSIELNEMLPLPYYFDAIHYESLNNEELMTQIDTYGILFYYK